VPDRVKPFTAQDGAHCSLPDDESSGLPKVLDLSHYYEAETEATSSAAGRSFFAIEMDKTLGLAGVAQEKEAGVVSDGATPVVAPVDSAIGNIEVMENNSRLAMNAVQHDLAIKCLKNVSLRQEQSFIHLFDALGSAPADPTATQREFGALMNVARSKIQSIKEIYLEEILTENGRVNVRFAAHIRPSLRGTWTLTPVHAVCEAIGSRRGEEVTDDDLEIVQLALLWSTLLLFERPTLFQSFSSPSDVYCRLSEIYKMGPRVSADSLVQQCIRVLNEKYLLTVGHKLCDGEEVIWN